MKFRIRCHGDRFIAERKGWLLWSQLRCRYFWSTYEGPWSPSVQTFGSVREAEEAIKTAIIAAGIARAHTRVVKVLPPWSAAGIEAAP